VGTPVAYAIVSPLAKAEEKDSCRMIKRKREAVFPKSRGDLRTGVIEVRFKLKDNSYKKPKEMPH
jgi:hypothetical protein